MAEARRRAAPGGERRYVASLIWPGRAPAAANDNRHSLRHRLLPLAASLMLVAAAACALGW